MDTDKFTLWTLRLIRLPFVLYILWFNINLWTAPADPVARADVLTDDLRAGAGADMQDLFPEGNVITNGLVGMSWIAIARDQPTMKPRALKALREIETRIDSESARAIFPANTHLNYGAFYRGYRGVLRAGILELDPAAPELPLFQADFDDIARALSTSSTPYLESYVDMAWPADTVFVVAALALHDKARSPRYTKVISDWVTLVQKQPGRLIAHSAHPRKNPEIARAVSNTVMSRMFADIDRDVSRSLYKDTRKEFAVSHAGFFSGMYEFPRDVSGRGDVDSGPLLFGISLSASVVGIAAARIHGDAEYGEPISQLFHAMGVPLGKRYAFGALPVGEAFFLWAHTTPLNKSPDTFEPLVPTGWRFFWHLLTLVVLCVLAIPDVIFRRRRRRWEKASSTIVET